MIDHVFIEDLGEIELTDDEEGYRKAQRLLNKADFGIIDITDSTRDRLNRFIHQYQTKRLRL